MQSFAPARVLRVLIAVAALLFAGTAARPADDLPETQFRVSRAALSTTAPADGVAGTQVLCDYFADEYSAKVGQHATVRVEVAPSFDALESGLRSGEIQYAYVTAMEYLRLQETVEAELVALTTPEGSERLSRAVVVVRADNPAASIASLKGRTFARSGRTSTVGYLYPQSLLVAAGLPQMDSFFARVLDVRSDKSAFYAVATGDADCASVDETLLATLTALSPGVAKRCRVLATSEPMPMGVVVASAGRERDGLTDIIQLIAERPGNASAKVREAMRLVRIGGLSSARAGDLDFVKRIWGEVNAAVARYIDPICGRECAAVAPGSTGAELEIEIGGESLRFCGEACREEFRRHDSEALVKGPRRVLVIGVLQPLGIDRKWPDVVSAMRALLDEVQATSQWSFRLEAYTSHAVATARIRSGVLSLVIVSATDYPQFHAEVGAVAIARALISETPDRLVLLAKSPNHRNGVTGLRGKRIAYSEGSDLPTAGYLRYLTRGIGVTDPEDLFSQTISCPSDASAIRAVSMDQADAALVSESALQVMSQLSPGVTRSLERAAVSSDFANGPVCVLPGIDPEATAYVRTTLLGLHEYPTGRQLLRMFGSIRMVAAQDADYEAIRVLLGNVEGQ